MSAEIEVPENFNHQPEKEKFSPFSETEFSVCALMAKGLSNEEIGVALGIKNGTVKNHTSSIFSKLECPGRIGRAVVTICFWWALISSYLEDEKFSLETVHQKFLEAVQSKVYENSRPSKRLDELLEKILESRARAREAKAAAFPFAPSQLEILKAMSEGKSIRKTAQCLDMTYSGVHNSLYSPRREKPGSGGILAKLGVDNIPDAIKKASELGLLENEENQVTSPPSTSSG